VPADLPPSGYLPSLLGLCVALGIGLLVGAERERRKGSSAARNAAGIRTFSVVALLGAVGSLMGGALLLGFVTVLVGGGALIAYKRSVDQDPGLTTEFALLLTCLLGGLAMQDAALAAGTGVVLALLLAARQRMHHFVSNVVSEQELHDIILFSAAALIVLPLAPDRFMGPFDAINPHALARLIVIVMAISAAGYVAMRWLGPRYGLPLAGFASGFISSTATIHSLGGRVARDPSLLGAAVTGAAFSSLATVVQMSLVIFLVQPALLVVMAIPLVLGGVAAAAYGLLFFVKGLQDARQTAVMESGRAFDLKTSVGFAGLLSVVMVLSAGLNALLGNPGMMIGAAVSGLADAHATAAAAASLFAAGKISGTQASVPILVGLTTNTFTKAIVAFNAGGKRYAMQIVPGLIAMVLAVWLGAWFALSN
jgi:uncharacterized membrane protein (DUF4010 family)